MKRIVVLFFIVLCTKVIAQKDSASTPIVNTPLTPLKWEIGANGKQYIQLSGLLQSWMRYNEFNPSTTINGVDENAIIDFGIRRMRLQLLGQLSPKVFFYTQLGMNSFSFISERKFGLFFHDITGEVECIEKKLTIGMGLNAWVGPLRFSSPSVGTIMGLDLPLFQQTTNDINDQFVRRMGIFAKGNLGRLNYRISVSKPFIVNYSAAVPIPGAQAGVPKLGAMGYGVSTFATDNPKLQYNTYLIFNIKDVETNKIPYNVGTYLGKKTIFNIGGGIQFQPDAMWYKELNTTTGSSDTIRQNLTILGIDVMWEKKLFKSDDMLHLYGAWMYSNYGKNYVRNFAPMNPTDAGYGNYNTTTLYKSGTGLAFPMNGTGHTIYAQVGYKFKENLLKHHGTLMPYTMIQYSLFDALNKGIAVYDIGLHWLWIQHNVKTSINYQNRPYLTQDTIGSEIETENRKSLVVLQLQLSF
ncbi:MAG: hypothetical protein MUE33_02575 [Cytophagaceae bacterium]|jgi:hypothetical protein|nr:hypothetical protein [Cytophagaceae bacterium]